MRFSVVLTSASRSLVRLSYSPPSLYTIWCLGRFQSLGSFKFLLNLKTKFHLHWFLREQKFYPGSSTTVKMSHVNSLFFGHNIGLCILFKNYVCSKKNGTFILSCYYSLFPPKKKRLAKPLDFHTLQKTRHRS